MSPIKGTFISPTFKSTNCWGPFSGLKIQDLIKTSQTFPCVILCRRPFCGLLRMYELYYVWNKTYIKASLYIYTTKPLCGTSGASFLLLRKLSLYLRPMSSIKILPRGIRHFQFGNGIFNEAFDNPKGSFSNDNYKIYPIGKWGKKLWLP